MKIGIDATWLPRDKRGMGMVVRNFLQGFQALESGHQLHFLTCKAKALPAIRQEVGALGPVTTFKEAPSDLEVAWYPWNRIDVPLPCAKVLTVHESLEFLGKWPPRYRNWSALYPQIEKIAVVSDTECHLVQSRLGDPQHKVVTCHNAISPKFLTPSQSQALAPAEGAENYRQTYSQGKPYLLFVGDPQEERKNLYGLLQALEKLPHLKEYRVMVAGILPRGPRPWWQRLWKPAYPPLLAEGARSLAPSGRSGAPHLARKLRLRGDDQSLLLRLLFCGRLHPRDLLPALNRSLSLRYPYRL